MFCPGLLPRLAAALLGHKFFLAVQHNFAAENPMEVNTALP